METLSLTRNLKKVFFFWQEICFIVVISIMMIDMLANGRIALQDTFTIVFFSLFALFLICLIGQFFWKNTRVAIVLAVLFALASLWMLLAVASEMAEMGRAGMPPGSMWFGIVLFLGLFGASVTMPVKY